MPEEPQNDDKAALAELRERARVLEMELAAVRASIGDVSAQVNAAEEADWDHPISIAAPPPGGAGEAPSVRAAAYLQPLPPYDALRLKWDLGSGLEARRPRAVSRRDAPTNAVLHLSGRLPDGTPWETHIPFSEMAREDGIVIGREPRCAQVVLNHACVSREHARLELTDDGLVVTDLGSLNGIAINEREFGPSDYRVPLRHGDVLTVGTIPLLTEIIR